MSRRVDWLGDAALLVSADSPEEAVALAVAVRGANWPHVADVVPAYAALGVHFDDDTPFTELLAARERLLTLEAVPLTASESTLHAIPVTYDGPDLATVAGQLRLTSNEVVRLHTAHEYRVMAVGFVPGFAYLGPLPEPLRGVPRLASPRTRVPAGSVGFTGDQTGIYPLDRPGGWPLIGHTTEAMVDLAAGYFRLRVGDRVRFNAESRGSAGEPGHVRGRIL